MLTYKIHNLPIYLLFSDFSLSFSCTDLYIYILIYLFHILLKSKAYFICAFVFFLRTHYVHTKNIVFTCHIVSNGTCYAIFVEREIIAVSLYAHPPKNRTTECYKPWIFISPG